MIEVIVCIHVQLIVVPANNVGLTPSNLYLQDGGQDQEYTMGHSLHKAYYSVCCFMSKEYKPD